MYFATVDPGRETGIAVWNGATIRNSVAILTGVRIDGYRTIPPRWDFLHVGTLRYTGARDFLDRLEATIRNYRLEFAVLERYVNFGRQYKDAERMVTQQTLICEAFRDVVLIGKRSWDPANTKPKMQAEIIAEYGIDAPRNEHERDAVHMGLNIFCRLPWEHADKAAHLKAAAGGEHKIKLVA